MHRKLLPAALCAALCSTFLSCAAHAQGVSDTVATTFSYTNFADRHGNPGEYYLSGAFRGTDTNHDGVIGLAELASLEVQGKQFVGCAANPGSFDNAYCGISRFTFDPTQGSLDFSVRWGNDGESGSAPSWERNEITTGDRVDIEYIDHRGGVYGPQYYWTSNTVLSIPAAVPEPGAAGMLMAGLALLGGLRGLGGRRRKP